MSKIETNNWDKKPCVCTEPSEMSTSVIRPRTVFAYVDEAIVDCRLRGIYNLCRRGNFIKAHDNAKDTLVLLHNTPIIDIKPVLYHEMIYALQWINMQFAVGDYRNVHKHVRELHYKIFAENLE